MSNTPEITTPESIERRSAYQAMEPVIHPSYWGVDQDHARRPGVPMMREPQEWPNTRYPPERQPGKPTAPRHGRSNKPMPPVFGTAVPLRGLSGVIRRWAYRYPDHKPRHWLLKMLGDRVDSWEHRVKKYLPVILPAVALLAVRRAGRSSKRAGARSLFSCR